MNRSGYTRRSLTMGFSSLCILLKAKLHERFNRQYQRLCEGLRRQPYQVGLFQGCLDDRVEEVLTNALQVEPGKGLASYYLERVTPAFLFNPADIEEIRTVVPGSIQKVCIDKAEMACRREFSFRGSPGARFPGKVDWGYRPGDNLDWTWDLNRHFFFLDLGRACWYRDDDRYLEVLCAFIDEWLDANLPSMRSENWRKSLEVSIRLNTWMWTFFTCLPRRYFQETALERVLYGIYLFASYLYSHLEYGNLGNHILIEAKNLYACGLLFPEFREAKKWARRGRTILLRECNRQILPDGCHSELSTMYHRIVLSELLELYVILDRNNIEERNDLADKLMRMIRFESAIQRPDGSYPLFGDSAASDDLIRFSGRYAARLIFKDHAETQESPPSEGDCWLYGSRVSMGGDDEESPGRREGVARFHDSGYLVMRNLDVGHESYFVMDSGPFGDRLSRGHGHSDYLSFEAFAWGSPFIIDPGYHSFHLPHGWRDFFRGTRAHNTIVIDETEQFPFRKRIGSLFIRRPDIEFSLSGKWISHACGLHYGYSRLPDPVVHERHIIEIKGEYWLIVDFLKGRGTHDVEMSFHLSPEVGTQPVNGFGYRLSHPRADGNMVLKPSMMGQVENMQSRGSRNPVQGWVSRHSGLMEPATVITYRLRTIVPWDSAVLIQMESPGSPPSANSSIRSLHGERAVAPFGHAGWEIEDEGTGRKDTLLLSKHRIREPEQVGSIRTDARWLYCENRPSEGIRRLAMEGGTMVDILGLPLLRSQRELPFLEIIREGTEIDIQSSGRCEFWMKGFASSRLMINGTDREAMPRDDGYLFIDCGNQDGSNESEK